jgi:phospholipase C
MTDCTDFDVTSPDRVPLSRRELLKGAAIGTGLGFVSLALPVNLRRALASPAPKGGSIKDIEHIVILMQENRSFDEYFGTLPGVRGFGDKRVKLPSGDSVFEQPDASHANGYLLPFRYNTATTNAQATPGLDHSWETQHAAWNGGDMNGWVAAKSAYTMGYFAQADIPFHFALAEAFTVCDAYHCSVLGPTNPNRLHMWTGFIDAEGKYEGPIIDNTPAYNNPLLTWTTYPERLQDAGITWQVYQEEDNYDDNALAWFKQYAEAGSSSPLYRRGMVKKPAGWFEADAKAGRLPQVSWIVAPSAQSEHPNWMPAAGAQYIASKIDAVASNPELWAKTAFILTYDENDGYFDHVPPVVSPKGTAGEWVTKTSPGGTVGDDLPVGLGFRVPAVIVSPWTVGGKVCSELLDHTSLIRFIEARFGVTEPNITAWRRQTVGDMTSAFSFTKGPKAFPTSARALRVAATTTELLAAQREVEDNPAPVVPVTNEPLPKQ